MPTTTKLTTMIAVNVDRCWSTPGSDRIASSFETVSVVPSASSMATPTDATVVAGSRRIGNA